MKKILGIVNICVHSTHSTTRLEDKEHHKQPRHPDQHPHKIFQAHLRK
jgi:hypothetical protein